MNGYDFDGVVTAGVVPNPGDVIITGRSWEEAGETLVWLDKLGIKVPVYFCPVAYGGKTIELSGNWKLFICNSLGVTEFFEDDERQANILREAGIHVTVI